MPMANLIKKLKGIDANKAYGPFDPSIKIIKLFADCFAVPLLHIFNQSFQSMKFPEVWKISNVCAIPKTTPCNREEELRPISLTSVLSKVQESYAVEWILEDVQEEISLSQFGGLVGSSAVLALVYLVHNWYQNMDSTGKDFRKAYDLINHNILLENFMDIGVRPSLIRWFATYLQGRRQMCTMRNQKSECKSLKGGIPQGSILGPLAFIIKINQLANVVKTPSDDHNAGSKQEDIVIFMDDTTLSEVIDVTNHVSGNSIGNSQSTVYDITRFTEKEQMELNAKKCSEMIVDFRKNKTVIPPVCIGERPMSRVKTFKLLGLWMNDNLNWETNAEYIIKKATKRLYFLKVLKSYGAPKNDLKIFYCCVIRSTLEYGAQVWNGNLTQAQRIDIERVQKRALRIIVPEYEYNRALQECELKTLQQRRDDLCVRLTEQMSEPSHKLHSLLPRKCSEVKERRLEQIQENFTIFSVELKDSNAVR